MGVINHPALPPAAAARIASTLLNRHSAGEIAAAIEILIDALDLLGGDPDAEDATDLEDNHALSPQALRYASDVPGCGISDPDAVGYLEWDQLGSHKADPHGGERLARDAYGRIALEDDEDDDPAEEDDPAGGNVEDDPQMGEGQAYYAAPPRYGIDQSAGPVNRHLIAQRHDLELRLADAERSRDATYADQLRREIERVARRDAALAPTNTP